MLNKLFNSVLEQDTAPIVVCDMDDIIVYMNPSAIEHYQKDLISSSIKDCHPSKANEIIEKVLWYYIKIFIITISTHIKSRFYYNQSFLYYTPIFTSSLTTFI